jgi:hypothetical protein
VRSSIISGRFILHRLVTSSSPNVEVGQVVEINFDLCPLLLWPEMLRRFPIVAIALHVELLLVGWSLIHAAHHVALRWLPHVLSSLEMIHLYLAC